MSVVLGLKQVGYTYTDITRGTANLKAVYIHDDCQASREMKRVTKIFPGRQKELLINFKMLLYTSKLEQSFIPNVFYANDSPVSSSQLAWFMHVNS